MGFGVTEVQQTPNPNAVKFMLDRPVSEGTVSFLSAEQAENHPIGRRLFAIPGVCSVLLLGDFVTVNKTAEAAWPGIKKKVRQVLSEA